MSESGHEAELCSFAGRGATDMAAWQQASAVLVALVQTLLPVEGAEGILDEADEQRLGMHITPWHS